ncbi:MAG: alpha-E domain-containing protein [Parvularculaceae bacterium]|nr:alpha-E domain-containing protein [Parvularculaceae bacterium]
MLGRTAAGLFWMFRYLERAENCARLIDAGFRIALTRGGQSAGEWESIAATAGVVSAYRNVHDAFDGARVIDFLLRDRRNPSSAMASIEAARTNARAVRTALTREVWEATNEAYLILRDILAAPVSERGLPEALSLIRREVAQVRGAFHGTMLRNDIFNFCLVGTYLERADNTARILDVKYYVLLPSPVLVGTAADNVQWDMILRAVSAQRSFRWLNSEVSAYGIAQFLILDRRMPRSLAYCYAGLVDNLKNIGSDYRFEAPSTALAAASHRRLAEGSMDEIFASGLHEFIGAFILANNDLGARIEADYRFYG